MHGLLHGAEERRRHGPELHLETELHAGARGAGSPAGRPSRGTGSAGLDDLVSRAGPDDALDADDGRPTEADLDPVVLASVAAMTSFWTSP